MATASPDPPNQVQSSLPRVAAEPSSAHLTAEPGASSVEIEVPRAEPLPIHRILFLDDDPHRAEIFLEWYPAAVWVQTSEECIAGWPSAWDEVHLDHDLGGETFVDPNRSDCGMEVVRWLCAESREPAPRHSVRDPQPQRRGGQDDGREPPKDRL